MLEAIKKSDQVVTVSPSFALEMQAGILGGGIDPWIREIAHEDKFNGIINGSNPDLWNPATNAQLKNWKDPETGEAIDLTFKSTDQDILEKKALIRIQVMKHLKKYFPEVVEKNQLNLLNGEIVLYVGRYDSSQKGLDKFLPIMRAASEKKASFITMGVGEDPEATRILDQVEKEAKKIGGCWITRGKKDNASLNMQLGSGAVPGIGALLRSIATLVVAPSSFEPCGLVQYEAWLFGAVVLATQTGGLADTIFTDLSSESFNGFLFEREDEWESSKQDQKAYEATVKALEFLAQLPKNKRKEISQRVMENAKRSSWVTAPKGLSPIQQYELTMAKAKYQSRNRTLGIQDVQGVIAIKSPEKADYFGKQHAHALYNIFGTHLIKGDKGRVIGTRFQTMAPHAQAVSVVIKGKHRDQVFPMVQSANYLGAWTIVLPEISEGVSYQYEITTQEGVIKRKADPFAFQTKKGSPQYSVVSDPDYYVWNDKEWLCQRAESAKQPKALNIYEVHLASWKKKDGAYMNYKELAIDLAAYCLDMGFNYVELVGCIDHPNDESWGYQATNFFAPTSRHGSLKDFQYFVDFMHQNKIGVILDFVPYHFATDEWALENYDGTKFFENSHYLDGRAPDGWRTRVFDLEKQDVRNFLISSAHFWVDKLHIDCLRVDAVAPIILPCKSQWQPNKKGGNERLGGIQFLKDLNTSLHIAFPGVLTMAENSLSFTPDTVPVEQGGYGFDKKWNFPWLHDGIKYMKEDPKERRKSYQWFLKRIEGDVIPGGISSFSHDEPVHCKGSLYNKMHGDTSQKLANLRLHRSFQYLFPSDGILTFMGSEFGQQNEWDYKTQINWGTLNDPSHKKIQKLSAKLGHFYLSTPAFWESHHPDFLDEKGKKNFSWLVSNHDNNAVFAYHRKNREGRQYAVIHNFSNQAYPHYVIPFSQPEKMKYLIAAKEVFNTDEVEFGGSGNYSNKEIVLKKNKDSNPIGFEIKLPALATVVIQEEFESPVTQFVNKMTPFKNKKLTTNLA